MKKAFRHISVYLLAGIVLLSTTGVSVHKLYCYCKGEMVASVFRPDDPCGMMDRQVEKSKCCTGGSCSTNVGASHKECGDCRSEFVKLNAQYLLFSTDFQVHAPAANFFAATSIENAPPLLTQKIAWANDLPPPAGRELLLWVQSFRC